MAKAIYSDGTSSVTYRGKTFRVGDKVKVYRDMGEWPAECEWKGEEVSIERVDSSDNTLYVLCPDDDTGYISLESLFEYSEEDAPHQAQPERKPWDMPELKPWMRVVNGNGTYVIAEVDGVLLGLRAGGYENIVFLENAALRVYSPPTLPDGCVNRHHLLNPGVRGELLWSKQDAEEQRKAFEIPLFAQLLANKQAIQARIDELKAELRSLYGE